MSCKRTRHPSRRAVTLVEAVLVVLVLALTVPAAMSMISEGNEARRQGADAARAITLASGVLEHIMADANSTDPGLGFAALSNSAAYLSTPTTGLYDRLDAIEAPYTAAGMTYDVVIGSLANASGTVTGDANQDVFRTVTVRVTFDDPDGTPLVMPVSVVLTELGS